MANREAEDWQARERRDPQSSPSIEVDDDRRAGTRKATENKNEVLVVTTKQH